MHGKHQLISYTISSFNQHTTVLSILSVFLLTMIDRMTQKHSHRRDLLGDLIFHFYLTFIG